LSALTRSAAPVLHVLGAIIMIFSIAMLVPLAFALFGGDAGRSRSRWGPVRCCSA